MSRAPLKAPFVTGSLLRHVLVMSSTGAIGTMAVFLVDLIDLFFLSLLKDTAVTAAIAYAGTVVLLNIALAVGCSIAGAALVAKTLGAGDLALARRYATSALICSLTISALLTFGIVAGADWFLSQLGAEGEAKRLALIFIWTMAPGYLFTGGAVCCTGILRGLGDARRAMTLTIVAAVVTLCADPVFIFGLDLGIQGAAIATALGFLVSFSLGLHGLLNVHQFLLPVRPGEVWEDAPKFWAIAYPAILSQLTMPFANMYVTHLMAGYGDQSVAGFAIICRVIPVAYCIIFGLQSAVGPIIGQNFGAQLQGRVRTTLNVSLASSTCYTLGISLLLFLLSGHVADAFNATGRTAEIVVFFCRFIGVSWVFVGAQFLANAAFNNIGHPRLSLAFSWGRATLGTIPFALIGARMAGVEGMLVGNAVGAVVFGIASISTAYAIVRRGPAPPKAA